jgi:sugar lactone lactonase YvrE
MMNVKYVSVLGVIVLSGVTGCLTNGPQCVKNSGSLNAKHIATLEGFEHPESALYDAKSGNIFVSNIECEIGQYWADDGKAFISLLKKDNTIQALRWVDSKPTALMNGNKGLTILGDHLYVADNTRLQRCTLTGQNVEVVASGFQKANDLCSDGSNVWLSDTGAGKIYCIKPSGEKREIKSPLSPNGLTFVGTKMFGVSWDLHEVYELDPTGKNEPVPFGLASHFTNLDGIEVLKDGTFIVSDYKGHKVCAISSDRKTVTTLIKLETPADIGIDQEAGVLYVPQLLANKVSVFKLTGMGCKR